MIGIQNIASYIPKGRVKNKDYKEEFDIDDDFIENKIGVIQRALKSPDEDTSDLCVKAFGNLLKKEEIDVENIECCIVVTQNPDRNIPHVSAIVHDKLNLQESCATFDISLGCSGYVYGLSVIQSFMQNNNMKIGLLFTADPYSKIIDPKDKNTSLLFGDAASVTLISCEPRLISGKYNFGSIGKSHKDLILDEFLYMNGRAIFNFAAKYVPIDTKNILEKNKLSIEDIDLFVFHQGSKYIIDTLVRRLGLDKKKVPYDTLHYGNTVSSSIPLVLENHVFKKSGSSKILISGFGVGLSWASTVLTSI